MNYEEFLNILYSFEEKYNIDEVEVFIQKVWDKNLFDNEILALDLAKFYFSKSIFKKAIYYFRLYLNNNFDEEIYESLKEAYYVPNKEKYEKIYKENVEKLEKYEYYIGDKLPNFEDISYKLLYETESEVYFLDEENKKIDRVLLSNEEKLEIIDLKDKCFMIYNTFSFKIVQFFNKETMVIDKSYQVFGVRVPIYIYLKQDILNLLLTHQNVELLFEFNRLHIFTSYEKVKEFFEAEDSFFPISFLGFIEMDKTLENVVIKEKEKQYENFVVLRNYILDYYEKEQDFKRILNRTPKILFITSKFTSIIQYQVRDLKSTFESIGIETDIIVTSKIMKNSLFSNLEKFKEFKPDIVFGISHGNLEGIINFPIPNLIYINWMQDIIPLLNFIINYKDLNKNMFLLNHFIGFDQLSDIKDFDFETRMIEAPICCSKNKYKKLELTQEDIEKYSCDISLVCNSLDPYGMMEGKVDSEILLKFLYEYIDYVLASDKFITSNEEVKDTYFKYISKLKITDDFREELLGSTEFLVKFIRIFLNYEIVKIAIADLLIENGYTNLKLWGREWSKYEKYKPYSMGIAENGNELSKIYQASKITLGCNPFSSVQLRIFETLFSGGFILNMHIPKKYDVCDINKFLEEGEDIVSFTDKKDLLNKIDYYLENEEERKRISENGKKKCLETLTYEILVNRILDHLQNVFKRREKCER